MLTLIEFLEFATNLFCCFYGWVLKRVFNKTKKADEEDTKEEEEEEEKEEDAQGGRVNEGYHGQQESLGVTEVEEKNGTGDEDRY